MSYDNGNTFDGDHGGNDVDEKKLNRMMTQIIIKEHKNIVTNEKNNEEMSRDIKKIIEEEADRCY